MESFGAGGAENFEKSHIFRQNLSVFGRNRVLQVEMGPSYQILYRLTVNTSKTLGKPFCRTFKFRKVTQAPVTPSSIRALINVQCLQQFFIHCKKNNRLNPIILVLNPRLEIFVHPRIRNIAKLFGVS